MENWSDREIELVQVLAKKFLETNTYHESIMANTITIEGKPLEHAEFVALFNMMEFCGIVKDLNKHSDRIDFIITGKAVDVAREHSKARTVDYFESAKLTFRQNKITATLFAFIVGVVFFATAITVIDGAAKVICRWFGN
jgi:hypothetical protein